MAAPSRFTADLAAFFDRHPLAETATYTPSGGAAASIYVHFSAPGEIDQGAVQYEMPHPSVMCKTSDVSSAGHSDTLKVRDVTYSVIKVEHTAAGTTRLVLSQD